MSYPPCYTIIPYTTLFRSSLTLNNVSASDAGTYNVVVSGICGNPLTNSASLTLNQNVAVSSAPVSLTNCPGTSASFSVSATHAGTRDQDHTRITASASQNT